MIRNWVSCTAVWCVASTALGQSAKPAIFVANNGNLEGAVTSCLIDQSGLPVPVQKLVLGIKQPSGPPHPGTNAYEISISDDGMYLATVHATALDPEQLTIIRVMPDATMSVAATTLVPNAPLDVVWVTDRRLVVAHSVFGGTNEAILLEWDPATATITTLHTVTTGGFTTYLARHPTQPVLYTQDSLSASTSTVSAWRIDAPGTLSLFDVDLTAPAYSLEIAVSPDGRFLYTTGGISNGRHSVNAFTLGPGGDMTPVFGSPFQSAGDSPADVAVTCDNVFAIVGHGGDATARSFFIGQDGSLTPTGFFFDVGTQGTLGDIQCLDDLVFISDNSTLDGQVGVYSFTMGPNGEFLPNGPIVDMGGVASNAIAVWKPQACYADCDGSGSLDLFDFLCFTNRFNAGEPYADCDGSGSLDLFDFLCFTNAFNAGCP